MSYLHKDWMRTPRILVDGEEWPGATVLNMWPVRSRYGDPAPIQPVQHIRIKRADLPFPIHVHGEVTLDHTTVPLTVTIQTIPTPIDQRAIFTLEWGSR